MIESQNIIYSSNATNIIQNIISWWTSHLQVIADFDKTLTYWNQQSAIAVLYNFDYLSKDYSKKAKELESFYLPKEEDSSIPYNERKILMNQRRTKHEQLLIESWLSKKHIENVVNSWILCLREWCHEFIDQLDSLWIPLIILSASWLWDSIAIYLQQHLEKKQWVYIISNCYTFDENWIAIKRNEPVITSLNKNETIISKENFPEIYDKIHWRDNIILLWDKIEDLNMADGIETNNILKIWFLNSRTEEKIQLYKQHYDIVINWKLWMQEIQKIINQFK